MNNYFAKFPENIIEVLESKGVKREDILLTFKSSISTSNVFCDVYIAADKENLYVLSGLVELGEVSAKNHKKGSLNANFKELDWRIFALSDMSDFKSEENISYGRYIAKISGNYIVLFNYTFTDRTFIGDFDKYLKKIKETGIFELEESDKDNPDFAKHEEKTCPKCGTYYPSPERKICPNCMEKGKLIIRLWGFVQNFRKLLVVISAMLIATSLIGIFIGYINGAWLFDRILMNPDDSWYGRILMLVVIMLVIDVVNMIFDMVYGVLMAKVAAMLIYDLKKIVIGAIQRLSLSFFTNRETGGLMQQFNGDTQTIYWFMANDMHFFFISIFRILLATGMMIAINPLLTLIAYITIPLFFFTFRKGVTFMRSLWAKMFSFNRDMGGVVSDVLTGMRVVKVFSKEKEETVRFDKKSASLREMGKRTAYLENTFFTFIWFILVISSSLVTLFGGWFVIEGALSYGLFVTFGIYLGNLMDPLGFFVNFTRRGAQALNASHRLFEIMDATSDVIESENPIKINNFKGAVEFREVDFAYNKNRKVIDGVSFNVGAGKAIGIVGHTGAGKSTLAALLTRLYDTSKGEILIDGVNVKNLSFDDLHSMISIVSQETYLFMGTIADNIKYAKRDATPEEVIRAAKIASAHDFIMKLPDGYQTRIGSGNQDLSGGEKQRLSIARAVLKDPKILIMDEATAAMDTETERTIQRSLSYLTRDRTTLIIAHRLSTLRDVDSLIVIENGKMTESGTHTELISKKGAYFNLYVMQAKALKSIGIEGE